jgi:hypothetical protein
MGINSKELKIKIETQRGFDKGLKLKDWFNGSQEVAQSVGTTPHEAEVTSSNLLPSSCVDMSKKKRTSSMIFL